MKSADAEAALVQRLTPEFLVTLREALLVIGWGRDMVELGMFEEDLYRLLGRAPPSPAQPYDYDDDDDEPGHAR